MIHPTIHLNGTGRDRLVEGYCEACEAIREALRATSENGPNARDYYPQGLEAFPVAAREHADRLTRLQGVLLELETIAQRAAGID